MIYSRAAELKKASMEGQVGWIEAYADVTFEVPCESDFDRHIDVTILILIFDRNIFCDFRSKNLGTILVLGTLVFWIFVKNEG